MGDGPMRLNHGCGTQRPGGWCNVDVDDHGNGNGLILVPRDVALPFDDGTFDGVVSHHVLQMVERLGLVPLLRELRRVAKPCAPIRLTVPDVILAFDAYDVDNADWFPIGDEIEDSIDGKFCVYLSQGGTTRSVFTEAWLMELLDRAGWHDIRAWGNDVTNTIGPGWLASLDTRLDESIVVEASA